MEAKLFIFAAVAISEVFSACKPTQTKFKNFQKTPKRSKPFVLELFTKRCVGLYEFYYDWKVEELTEEKTLIQKSSESSISIDGYNYDSKTCFNISYLVTAEVSHYPDMTFADQISDIFNFEPDFMHIEIKGGSQKGHRFGEDLIIDAETLSRDTSYPPNEDAFEGNFVFWESEPSFDFVKDVHDLKLTIPKEYLLKENVYAFKINVTRTKIPNFIDVKVALQSVIITDPEHPRLQLKCIKNCVWPQSRETTAFGVECFSNCDKLNFTWKVSPEPSKSKVRLGNGHDIIIFRGQAFDDGDEINVSLEVDEYPYSITLTYVSGLVTGLCSIFPETGISGVTMFSMSCKGFSSPFGLSRVLIYQHQEIDGTDAVLIDEYNFKETTELYLGPGNPSYITIVVEDHAYLQTKLGMEVQIEEFKPKHDIPISSYIKILVLSRDSTSVTSYSFDGYNNEVVQLICCLLEAIKTFRFTDYITRDLHKHMVEAIARSETVRLTTALQRILILCKLQKYLLKSDTVTSRLIAEALLSNTLSAHYLYNHLENTVTPHFYIELICNFTLSLSSELLERNEVILNILRNEILPHTYDSYDDFVSQKIQIRNDFRLLITDLIIALQTNCLTTLYQALPEQQSFQYRSTSVAVKTKRKSILRGFKLRILIKNFSKSRIVLPVDLVNSLLDKYTFIDYQFIVFLRNPFWWHENASTLNTQVAVFDVFNYCDKIRIVNKPFLLFLELISVPSEVITGTIVSENYAAYRVELEPQVTLFMEFFVEGEHPHDYLVTWSSCVCTEDDFSSSRSNVISSGTSKILRTIKVENENDMKAIYVCVKKKSSKLTYRFMLTTFSCMHWDLIAKAWVKGGCKVLTAFIKTKGTLKCECNHISLFTGEIIAPRTTIIVNSQIDFSIVFVKNYVMVAFIIGLLLLWVLSLILAHYKDKSMKKKNVVYKLDDNVPGDSNPYLVVVFTGIFYDAQTTADVAFRIVGDKAKSRAHVIKCQGTTLLKRNSQDWFVLHTPHYLGRLRKIQIWHNSKGRYPHWYCDRVIVQDLKVGEQYCFTVKKWFSVIWGSGRIYREIRLKRPSTKMSNILFRTQFERDIKDKHIWMSVLSRDIQSNFNSKERVSTGFCFLFVSMLANALLYSVPHNAPADSIDAQSNFTILATNIIVFIESWLFATSVSFLIYFIFKNSAPL